MDAGYLFAALVWGAIGFGFFLYGKKQKSVVPLVGGLLLMGVSYFFKTPVTLTIAGLVIIAGIYVLKQNM